MAENKMVPQLRFRGFSDEWKQRKLTDSFDFLKNNTLSRAELDNERGIAKNLHYGDVLIKFGEYLDISQAQLPFIISQQVVDKFKGSLLQEGDVIMADTAEDETVGKCSEIAELRQFPIVSGLHTIPMRPKEKFAAGYLGYYMNSTAYHDQLLPLMQGIKVTSVSKAAIQNTDIAFPSDTVEQAAIGQYFIQLDNLITLHQQKHDKLLALKKSMLEKMFPKAGSTVPEVRFAGFTAPWERRKLSEILERRQVYQRISADAPRLAFAAGQGVIPLSERKTNNRDQLIADEASKRYLLTEYNDLVYNPANLKYGAIGRNKYGKGVISPIYVTFTTTEEASFVERIIITERFKNMALQFEEGTVVKRQSVSSDSLLSFEEWISPYRKEQVLIGKMFDKIDSLITLHQRKYEKLKQLKQSLLQKMFV